MPFSIPPVCHAFLIDGVGGTDRVEQTRAASSYIDIIPIESVSNTNGQVYGYHCIGVDDSSS